MFWWIVTIRETQRDIISMGISIRELEELGENLALQIQIKEKEHFKTKIFPLLCSSIDKTIKKELKGKFHRDKFCATLYYQKGEASTNLIDLNNNLTDRINDKNSYEFELLSSHYPEWEFEGKSFCTDEWDQNNKIWYKAYHKKILIKPKNS